MKILSPVKLKVLHNLFENYTTGSPWKLSDETRKDIISILDPNQIDLQFISFTDQYRITYKSHLFPEINRRSDLFDYAKKTEPDHGEYRLETRESSEITKAINRLMFLEKLALAFRVKQAIEEEDYRYFDDIYLMELLRIDTISPSEPKDVSQLEMQYSQTLFEEVPKEMQTMLDLLKDMRKALDEKLKEEKDRKTAT